MYFNVIFSFQQEMSVPLFIADEVAYSLKIWQNVPEPSRNLVYAAGISPIYYDMFFKRVISMNTCVNC